MFKMMFNQWIEANGFGYGKMNICTWWFEEFFTALDEGKDKGQARIEACESCSWFYL